MICEKKKKTRNIVCHSKIGVQKYFAFGQKASFRMYKCMSTKKMGIPSKNPKRYEIICHMPKTIESFIRSTKSVAMTYFMIEITILWFSFKKKDKKKKKKRRRNCWMWHILYAEEDKRTNICSLQQIYGLKLCARRPTTNP